MTEKLSPETYYKVNKGGTFEYVSTETVKANPELARQITAASALYRKVLGQVNVYRQDKATRDAYFNS